MYSPMKAPSLLPHFTLKDSLHCGKKDEILDSITPADLAHAVRTATVLDVAVLIQIFRPGVSMKAGYILNKQS